MNKIFLWCVPLGTGSGYVNGSTRGGDVVGYAMSDEGIGLASHLSSSPEWSKHDMGYQDCDWKHDVYSTYYPNGYELVWLEEDELDSNPEWVIAFELNKKMAEMEKDK